MLSLVALKCERTSIRLRKGTNPQSCDEINIDKELLTPLGILPAIYDCTFSGLIPQSEVKLRESQLLAMPFVLDSLPGRNSALFFDQLLLLSVIYCRCLLYNLAYL